MSNDKPTAGKFVINVIMFFVLIFINILPIAIFVQDGLKAVFKLDIDALTSADNKLYITLIAFNLGFAALIFMVKGLRTGTTKYWAYLAIGDAIWWIYCMMG
jgi:hypothetical protein